MKIDCDNKIRGTQQYIVGEGQTIGSGWWRVQKLYTKKIDNGRGTILENLETKGSFVKNSN